MEYKPTSLSAYRIKCPLCRVLLPNTDEAKRAHEGSPVHQNHLRQLEEVEPKKEAPAPKRRKPK